MPNGRPLTSGEDVRNDTVIKEDEPLSIVGIPNDKVPEKVVLFEFHETVHVWWLVMSVLLLIIAI